MDDRKTMVDSLIDRAEGYGQTSLDLLKLKAIDKTSDVVSTIAAKVAVLAIFWIFFLILNIGIALWIGEYIGKIYYGFFLVAGFYALLALCLHLFKNQWIKTPVSNSMINHLLK